MPEYDMPIEEQMKRLVKTLDERFDQIDKRFDRVDERFDQIDKKFDKVDERLDEVKERLGEVEETLGHIRVRLDDTNGVAKLGLEGLQGLRESMDAQFAAAAKTNADQTGLLKAVLVHVRNRVEVLERPKPRRR